MSMPWSAILRKTYSVAQCNLPLPQISSEISCGTLTTRMRMVRPEACSMLRLHVESWLRVQRRYEAWWRPTGRRRE